MSTNLSTHCIPSMEELKNIRELIFALYSFQKTQIEAFLNYEFVEEYKKHLKELFNSLEDEFL